ncbi:MAG: tetratricopeptide repeat protein [Proteobacteria bacterium]|nr:tetratricopeptide repeat protein [Pseudomonadota bacterium]
MADGLAEQLQAAQRLHGEGRLTEAETAYDAVLRAAPGDAAALSGLATLALQTGRTERAVEFFARSLAAGGDSAHLQNNLAIAQRRLGRLAEAVTAYDRAISLRPDYAEAHNNRGNTLLDLNRPAEALESFERALALRPGDAEWRANRGLALLALGRPGEALASFEAAIAAGPDLALAHFGRGSALADLERPEEAILALDEALRLRPGYVAALNNRATLLYRLERFAAALADFDEALAGAPGDAAIHSNRGEALRRMGRLDEALADFETAIAAAPDLADAHFRRALALLAQGRFAEGWEEYEHRWRVAAFVRDCRGQTTPDLQARMAIGLERSDLTGRRLLLLSEQGVGDAIMFASLLPDVMAEAGAVALVCEARLHGLLGATFPHLALFDRTKGQPPTSGDEIILPIGGLARLYRNRREDFPGRPFLTAGEAARARWAEALGPRRTPLRIGISWKGGTAGTRRNQRSMPLADLRPILELPGVEAVSLQYGDPRPEIEAANAALPRPVRVFEPDTIADFEDLAALIQGLDLVVSVQTAVVHLAGALGVPALVMIPAVAEWRYGASGPSMPWYASLELFRQGPDALWPPVIAKVAERLRSRTEKP